MSLNNSESATRFEEGQCISLEIEILQDAVPKTQKKTNIR